MRRDRGTRRVLSGMGKGWHARLRHGTAGQRSLHTVANLPAAAAKRQARYEMLGAKAFVLDGSGEAAAGREHNHIVPSHEGSDVSGVRPSHHFRYRSRSLGSARAAAACC